MSITYSPICDAVRVGCANQKKRIQLSYAKDHFNLFYCQILGKIFNIRGVYYICTSVNDKKLCIKNKIPLFCCWLWGFLRDKIGIFDSIKQIEYGGVKKVPN